MATSPAVASGIRNARFITPTACAHVASSRDWSVNRPRGLHTLRPSPPWSTLPHASPSPSRPEGAQTRIPVWGRCSYVRFRGRRPEARCLVSATSHPGRSDCYGSWVRGALGIDLRSHQFAVSHDLPVGLKRHVASGGPMRGFDWSTAARDARRTKTFFAGKPTRKPPRSTYIQFRRCRRPGRPRHPTPRSARP